MKTCFVCDSYPVLPHYGGIDVYVQTAAHALAARGHQVHVLIGRHAETFDREDGQVFLHGRPIRWIPLFGRWLPGLGESICYAWFLRRLYRQHRFDIVEFPNWEGIGFVSCLLRICPIVVRLHTSMLESVQAQLRPPTFGEKFMMWMEKQSARLAKATITHSHAQINKLGPHYGLSNTALVPHGIRIPKQPSPECNLAVFCAGGMNQRKGIDTFLAAIPLVLREVPEACFWLAGADKERVYEQSFYRMHPDISSDRVLFLGFITDTELQERYHSCAIYASASIQESFGLTFVEAMAHGKPVVGCNIAAMQETIDHEKTGLLVAPSDPKSFAASIVRLLRDFDLRKAYGAAARLRVEGLYSAERMASGIESFYESVTRGAEIKKHAH